MRKKFLISCFVSILCLKIHVDVVKNLYRLPQTNDGIRGVGAKFEVVRQILRFLASFIIRKLEQYSCICIASYVQLAKAT